MNSILLDTLVEYRRKCAFIYKTNGHNMTSTERRELSDLYMYFDGEYKLAKNNMYNPAEDTDVPQWCKDPTIFYPDLR